MAIALKVQQNTIYMSTSKCTYVFIYEHYIDMRRYISVDLFFYSKKYKFTKKN